jgi:methylenetetrahydrofolate dehydrogenase (NADP+)/methenyltetrahydrofolate cyclohydrolase
MQTAESNNVAKIIDGKAFAESLRKKIAEEVAELTKSSGKKPGLAVVLVGEDPASQIYVRNKGKKTVECGMESLEFIMPEDTSQEELLAKVDELNNDPNVHGILVQLPLPGHLSEDAVIQSISPEKDVDGFHIYNRGRLVVAEESLVPCTPQGCLMLIKDQLGGDISGKHAVVIGRSNIVGKPMAQLLLNEGCTVTVCHSKTYDIIEHAQKADILVAAVGRPGLITKDWVKPGACVIDVGINRVDDENGKSKVVGDVALEVFEVAGSVTPVPGGVGPMTIACLLNNTLKAFKRIEKI